jgi:hypothetical protein
VIKLRRIRWVGHVAYLGGGIEEVYTGFWWENLRGRDHLEDPGLDEGQYYDGSSGSQKGGEWSGLIWLRRGTGGRHL